MLIPPFLAQRLMEERVKDALRMAEEARLVKMVQKSKGTQPFLLAAMQRLRDWRDGGNGRHQLTIDTRRLITHDQNQE
jgi:hypothetical protein